MLGHTRPSLQFPDAGSTNFQSFGQYSEFLRSAVADEESLQMGEDLQALAAQVEALIALLPQIGVDLPVAAQALMRLVDALREHRTMLLALGADWHHFYEFDAHFVAFNQFRVLVTQWALHATSPGGSLPLVNDFDVVAWRFLGAGAMLLDVYEQSRSPLARPVDAPPAVSWWGRWTAWWRGHREAFTEQRQPGQRGRRRSDQ